jgi:hypothetical protein
MMRRVVGVGAQPPTEGRPSVLPNAIFGLIKPSYLEQARKLSQDFGEL